MTEAHDAWFTFHWLQVTSLPAQSLFVGVLVLLVSFKPMWGLYGPLLAEVVIPVSGVVEILGYGVTLTDVTIIICISLLAFHPAVRRRRIELSPLLFSMLIIVFVRGLSTFATPSLFVGSSIALLRYVEVLLLFVMVVSYAGPKGALNLLYLFLGIIGVQSIISIVQVILGLNTDQTYISRGGTLGDRGTILAWLQVYALLIGLSLAHHARNQRGRIGWRVYSVLIVIGFASTLGRSAWITGVVGLIIYNVIDHSASLRRRAFRTMLDTAIFAFVLSVITVSFVADTRFLDSLVSRTTISKVAVEGSWNERLALWKVALEMFMQNPILGVGTGNYADLSSAVLISKGTYNPFLENSPSTHNYVLNVLSETGLLGFSAYLFFAATVIKMVLSDQRRFKHSNLYPFLLPVGSAILALLLGDWHSWTSFFVWSMLFLALYAVLRKGAFEEMRYERKLYDDEELAPNLQHKPL